MAKITIDIPKNTYKTPSKPNKKVVKLFCNILIGKDPGNDLHRGTYRVNGLHNEDILVVNHWGEWKLDSSWNPYWADKKELKNGNVEMLPIHGIDVKTAIEALVAAGWHVYRHTEYARGTNHITYTVSMRPFKEGYTEVKTFVDQID